MLRLAGTRTTQSATDWDLIRSGPEFTELKRRLRRFVVPVTAGFLGWYVIFVLLADFAHGFMATKIIGNVNVGLVRGILQFVSTFVITGRPNPSWATVSGRRRSGGPRS